MLFAAFIVVLFRICRRGRRPVRDRPSDGCRPRSGHPDNLHYRCRIFIFIGYFECTKETFRVCMVLALVLTAVITVLVGTAILRGKADDIIAGWNSAPIEERKKYDLRKVRLLTACFLFVTAALSFLLLYRETWAVVLFLSLFSILTGIFLFLSHTWAKRKTGKNAK